jgi:DNA invertase Pin-like site-specific DNA recombinase
MLEAGNGSMLVVAKVDRLARSLRGFAQVMETSQREGWAVATLDLAGVDTSTPAGSMVANVTASVAQYERQLISQRTKDALGAKKARGETLGRPKLLPTAVVDRIRFLRPNNTLQAIADLLNAEGVPTAHGGVKWHPSTVKHVHDAV